MSEPIRPADVVVVGGGIIGLAVAWRARAKGLSVTVLERDVTGRGTSHVAAGMLAPVAEAEFGDAGQALLELGLRLAEMWPGFAGELEAAAGGNGVGLRATGTLVVARDEDEARELERQLAFRHRLGLTTTRLLPSEAREREPALAPTVRLALEAPRDHSVDPRLVLAALRRACAAAGVELRLRPFTGTALRVHWLPEGRATELPADAGRLAGFRIRIWRRTCPRDPYGHGANPRIASGAADPPGEARHLRFHWPRRGAAERVSPGRHSGGAIGE